MSNSLRPYGLQHNRPPCLSLSSGLWSNSCPLSQWCHPTISSSVTPFSCLQFFPASGFCPTSQLFASGSQSIGASASASVLPMNSQVDCHSVQFQFSHSIISDSLRPHEPQHSRPPCPSPTQSLLKLMSIESVMASNHLILCCPLLLPPSIFPSNRVFSNESALRIRWPKYWSFSFNISPSNEYSVPISFRIDWLDLLAV